MKVSASIIVITRVSKLFIKNLLKIKIIFDLKLLFIWSTFSIAEKEKENKLLIC